MRMTNVVMVSGGRTSGYLAYLMRDEPNTIFIFNNTGAEHPETIKFIEKIDSKWLKGKLIKLESVINPIKGLGTTFKIIKNYSDLTMGINLFENMVKKYGIPNLKYRHCTRELKLQPSKKYLKFYNMKNYKVYLGIRGDEPKRINEKTGFWGNKATYILSHIDKQDIFNFWNKQNFDLEIDEHLGNCEFCFFKTDKKLKKVFNERPHLINMVKHLEQYKRVGSIYETGRFMFRKNRNVEQLIKG